MKIRIHKHRARWVGLTVATLQCSGLVHAQAPDAPPANEAEKAAAAGKPGKAEKSDRDASAPQVVTVTAQRRTEPLQTSSTSATVLSGEDLSRAGIGVVDQLQFSTPSATVNNFGQGINFDIRGIGKAETNTQTTTGVIIYRDGVATFPGYFAEEPYYDIASVQILRGPQGTFGGQNATGGAVIVDSNDPDPKGGYHGYASVQAGNYHDLGLQGAFNLPLTSTLAARVAINAENRDSFYDIAGPWTGGNGALRSRSARVGLLYKPGPAFSMLLKTDVNTINMGAYPADPVNSPSDPFDITANAQQKALDRFLRSVLKTDVNFDNGVKLRSITGYQHGNTTYRADLDGTSTGNQAFVDSVYETIWSQELNLISPDAGPFTWLLGAYAQKDTYTFPAGEYIIGAPLGDPTKEYSLSGKNPKRTAAVFGQVAYQLTDRTKLSVDGRFSKARTSNDVSVLQFGTPLHDEQTAKFTNFSGKVALDWKLTDDHFLYAFVANAARPGGLNVPVGLGAPAPFEAETVKTLEAGWKSSWLDKHVQSQASVFYNKYDDFQVTIAYPALPTFGIELNTINPTHIYGFEEQLQAHFGNGWAAKANVGWLHSKLGTFYANDPRVAGSAPCAPATGPASSNCVNLGGHQQTYAPELTLSGSLERSFVFGENVITPRVNVAYISSQWGTLFENRSLGDRLDSRKLVGAQVDWTRGDFLATLYGTNLSDDHYIAAVGSRLRYAGAPRQYGLRITQFF